MKSLIGLQLMVCTLGAQVRDFPDPYPEIYDSVQVLPLFRHGWQIHYDAMKEMLAMKKGRRLW